MKKHISLFLCLILLLGLLGGCGSKQPEQISQSAAEKTAQTSADASASAGKLSVVTTIFPEYDWVREIMGDRADNAEITLLLDNGADLHSYQPSVDDIVKISGCDLFVYVGGESDEWVEDALKEATNPNMIVIDLLETLGDTVKEEEVVEGMQHDHDHHHEHEEIEEDDVKDRSLSEFSGEWKSLLPMLEAGELDPYVEHHAEEHGEPQSEVHEELAEKWACDAEKVGIDGDIVTFTYANGDTVSAKYAYAGRALIKADDGDITGVRYQFETDSANAPKYLQLNDHGHEPAEEVEHFHIYFGSDGFDALLSADADPFFVPSTLDAEGVLEELMGGHEHDHDEHDEEHEEHDHEHHHEEGEVEYDEHVWLSLKNAKTLCGAISDALGRLDAANADAYAANAASYIAKLDALDMQYAAAVNAADVKTVLFGDRFPFRYLVDDYGLDYYAAFVGCSAETEASFETVVFLANKVDELGLKNILTIESSDGKIARTIIENTAAKNAGVLQMDSMQSTTAQQIAGGATYLAAMESNLEILKEALGTLQ